jgi:hypothetical protein
MSEYDKPCRESDLENLTTRQQNEQLIDHEGRLSALEAKYDILIRQNDRMYDRMSQLLELKHKGAGAFWLFSLIAGSGLIGAVSYLVDWLKHMH